MGFLVQSYMSEPASMADPMLQGNRRADRVTWQGSGRAKPGSRAAWPESLCGRQGRWLVVSYLPRDTETRWGKGMTGSTEGKTTTNCDAKVLWVRWRQGELR